jgi:hypothetical protein
VFQIPIDEERVGYGQVLAKFSSIYFMAVFNSAYPHTAVPDVASIVRDRIRFAAETVDVKIWAGDWPVVGRVKPQPGSFCLPVYKEHHYPEDEWHVHSFDERHRRATDEEISRLPLRISRGPQMLQDALRAAHGAAPWKDEYGQIEYERIVETSDIVV